MLQTLGVLTERRLSGICTTLRNNIIYCCHKLSPQTWKEESMRCIRTIVEMLQIQPYMSRSHNPRGRLATTAQNSNITHAERPVNKLWNQ